MFEKKEFINVSYAGFWVRFMAGFTDAIIVSFLINFLVILSLVILAFFGIGIDVDNLASFSFVTLFSESIWIALFIMIILPILVAVSYNIGFICSDRRATIGMRGCGICIQDEYGDRLTKGVAATRLLIKNIYLIPAIIFLILAAIDINNLSSFYGLVIVDQIFYQICRISFYILIAMSAVGNLMISIAKENKSFHDMLCSTRVVFGLAEVDKLNK